MRARPARHEVALEERALAAPEAHPAGVVHTDGHLVRGAAFGHSGLDAGLAAPARIWTWRRNAVQRHAAGFHELLRLREARIRDEEGVQVERLGEGLAQPILTHPRANHHRAGPPHRK